MIKTHILETKNFEVYASVISEDCLRLSYIQKGVVPNAPSIGVILKSAEHDLLNGKRHFMTKNALSIKIDFEKWEWALVWDEEEGSLSVYKDHQLVSKDEKIEPLIPHMRYHRLGAQALYGLGEKYDWMNRIETTTENYNTDVIGISALHHGLLKTYHTAIPYHVTVHSGFTLGRFFDNTYRTKFDLDKYQEGYFDFWAEGGTLDSYILVGKSVKDVTRGFAKLSGTMPMPPINYLGYQQCRWSYMTETEVLDVARKMRNHQIPLDIIYLDIDYMQDYKVFTYDKKRFKNIAQMTKTLKQMGIKTVAIVDPGVKVEKGYSIYEEGLAKDYFVKTPEGEPYVGVVWPGDSVFPDFLRKEVRNWWANKHEALFKLGIDGIWNDMNEPADMSTKDKTLPKDSVHLSDEGAVHTHDEIHNIYASYEAMSTYGALKEQYGKRPFVLTRAAYAGTQRHAALWMGDNSSLWEQLESSIAMMVNLGLSGYSFIGGDVGGFLEDSSGELLLRWTQLGAFMPLFRNHASKDTRMQEPWQFGEKVLSGVRSAIELRYQLITYLYQAMRASHLYGDPVIRPLFYNQNDKESLNIQDQFLFGEDILVCPITRPGQTRRMLYLPEGDWHDFYTGKRFEGGKFIIGEAGLDKILLFVRGGSIVPIDPIRSHIEGQSKSLELRLYGKTPRETSLYFDDGMSFDFEKGHCAMVHLNSHFDEDTIALTVEKEGPYPVPKLSARFMGEGCIKAVSLQVLRTDIED